MVLTFSNVISRPLFHAPQNVSGHCYYVANFHLRILSVDYIYDSFFGNARHKVAYYVSNIISMVIHS